MITRLKLSNFRNYAELDLKLGGGSVILTGANGSGKTNILEAISLLSPGRGMRMAKLSEMDKAGAAQPWAVFTELSSGITVGTGRDAEAESDKRIVKINGTAIRNQVELGEHIAILALTPAMDHTFAEGASSRRDYLDKLTTIFHPDHVRHLAIYHHAKSERLKLLARYASDTAWLSTLERRMAEHGIAIAAARLETVGLLQVVMGDAWKVIGENSSTKHLSPSTFPKAVLAIEGAVEHSLESMKALEAEESLAREFATSRLQDASSGQTSCGIGKSDFRVIHSIKQMPAELCSTGEQKALLLSITLAAAHARKRWKGTAPVLLLDEVVAHLDPEKRRALAGELSALETQVWLTGTDPELFADFPAHFQRFSVADGVVKE